MVVTGTTTVVCRGGVVVVDDFDDDDLDEDDFDDELCEDLEVDFLAVGLGGFVEENPFTVMVSPETAVTWPEATAMLAVAPVGKRRVAPGAEPLVRLAPGKAPEGGRPVPKNPPPPDRGPPPWTAPPPRQLPLESAARIETVEAVTPLPDDALVPMAVTQSPTATALSWTVTVWEKAVEVVQSTVV